MIAAVLGMAGAVALAQTPAKPASGAGVTQAHADIKGEGITGRATFVERQQGTGKIVEITLTVSGLKPGMHGVHLHAVGKCEPDFTAAGGHFDPGPSGNPDPDANHPFHMGDIPNLEVGANGRGDDEGDHEPGDAVGRSAVALRRRRFSHHHPRQSGSDDHGCPQVRRQRRTTGRVRGDREVRTAMQAMFNAESLLHLALTHWTVRSEAEEASSRPQLPVAPSST